MDCSELSWMLRYRHQLQLAGTQKETIFHVPLFVSDDGLGLVRNCDDRSKRQRCSRQPPKMTVSRC